MTDEIYRSPPFSEPVRKLVAGASDEQLAWMVGPDRDFYSEEAIEAATWELDLRRSQKPQEEERGNFEVAAFLFGPFWYFYHGMFGRGALIGAFMLAAAYGLHPVAMALGLPPALWVMLVVVAVGGYCGRFAARDLSESKTQARLYPRHGKPPKPRPEGAGKPKFVQAALVGCRGAAEQAKALLEAEGIRAFVKCEDTGIFGPGAGLGTRSVLPAQVFVPKLDLDRAKEVLVVLLSEIEANPQAGCEKEDQEIA